MSKKQNNTFTNSAGDTFPLFPLNPLEEDLVRKQVEKEWLAEHGTLPEPPAFEIKTEAGDVSRVPLKSIKDADTPELQEAWLSYERDSEALNGMFTMRYLTSCFLCVDADPEAYPLWKRRMRMLKLDMSEDEADRFILFCNTHVIRSKEDIVGLIVAATRSIANISEDAMQAAQARFQRAMEAAAVSVDITEGARGG